VPRDAGHRGQRVLSRLSGRERGAFAGRLVRFAITRVAVPRRANGPDPEPPLGVHEHESSGDRREHPLMPHPGRSIAPMSVHAILPATVRRTSRIGRGTVGTPPRRARRCRSSAISWATGATGLRHRRDLGALAGRLRAPARGAGRVSRGGLGHLQCEALLTVARLLDNVYGFALVAMLGLLGLLRIFEPCGGQYRRSGPGARPPGAAGAGQGRQGRARWSRLAARSTMFGPCRQGDKDSRSAGASVG
jgi:hypothetical protein